MTSRSKASGSPAADLAKEKRSEQDGVVVLATGYKARFRPVAASLITEVSARIADPAVPMWHHPDKDRDEPNPNDPGYLRELAQAETKRAEAIMDVFVMFGVDLVDGVPDEDDWLKKLQYMERRGRISLEGYDLEDEVDREFLFKRFIAVSADDHSEVMRRSGVTEDMIAQAAKTFPGDQARGAD